MINEKEKTTVPIPSVGADGEQSLSYVTNEIIVTGNEEINPIDESMEEMLRQMQRMSDPSYLATMTMSQLYDTVYESRLPIIDGLLYPGTYLFVGAPKVGKSFLMAQIAYHVSTGLPLWKYSVHAGTVLWCGMNGTQSTKLPLTRKNEKQPVSVIWMSVAFHRVSDGKLLLGRDDRSVPRSCEWQIRK